MGQNIKLNKYSFISLLNSFVNGVQIPILQRDYAQGRATEATKRNNFINAIAGSINTETELELDFVYGSSTDERLIPLDGQQRLTTLFLLHWYSAYNNGMLDDDIKELLHRFAYLTRATSREFCQDLINKSDFKNDTILSETIKNQLWYRQSYNYDPTVKSMLVMLDSMNANSVICNMDKQKTKLLFDGELITFYFFPINDILEPSDLYIKMNARGKQLTDFEKFKASFEEVLSPYPEYQKRFEDSIEQNWLDALWHRRSSTNTIDAVFMYYFCFITEMLFVRDKLYLKSEPYFPFKMEAGDDKDWKYIVEQEVIEKCYGKGGEERLDFLFFSLDLLCYYIKNDTIGKYEWDFDTDSALLGLFDNILLPSSTKRDYVNITLLFSAISHHYHKGDTSNLNVYLRVIRNLLVNYQDLGIRNLSNTLESVRTLIDTKKSVYELLCSNPILPGTANTQVGEEVFKARLLLDYPHLEGMILKAEKGEYTNGKIRHLIYAAVSSSIEEIDAVSNLRSLKTLLFNDKIFQEVYSLYSDIAKDDFVVCFGDLLATSVYELKSDRVTYNGNERSEDNYWRNRGLIKFLYEKVTAFTNLSTVEYLEYIEKQFVNAIADKYNSDLAQVNNSKDQLYLYYIITTRLNKKTISDFFCYNRYNFGKRDDSTFELSEFKSLFNEEYVFQTFATYFQTNDKTILQLDRKESKSERRTAFARLLLWANQ